MPIYEYRCKECKHQFDILQSLGADGKDLSCPNCSELAPEKLISVFASSGNESSTLSGSCSPGAGFT